MKKLFLLLIVCVICSAGCKQKESGPIGEAPRAIGLENEIKFLKDILKEDPKNLDALIKLGNAYMDSKRFKEAIDAYSRALEIDPKNVNVRVDMGTCYRYAGMPNKAVEEYKKALSIDPKHIYANKNLGVVLAFDLGDREGAIKAFETYLSLAPGAPDAKEVKAEIERLKSYKKQ